MDDCWSGQRTNLTPQICIGIKKKVTQLVGCAVRTLPLLLNCRWVGVCGKYWVLRGVSPNSVSEQRWYRVRKKRSSATALLLHFSSFDNDVSGVDGTTGSRR